MLKRLCPLAYLEGDGIMSVRILVLNPGSTSTKIAIYEGEKPLFVESIEHSREELAKFEINDQYPCARKQSYLN